MQPSGTKGERPRTRCLRAGQWLPAKGGFAVRQWCAALARKCWSLGLAGPLDRCLTPSCGQFAAGEATPREMQSFQELFCGNRRKRRHTRMFRPSCSLEDGHRFNGADSMNPIERKPIGMKSCFHGDHPWAQRRRGRRAAAPSRCTFPTRPPPGEGAGRACACAMDAGYWGPCKVVRCARHRGASHIAILGREVSHATALLGRMEWYLRLKTN